MKKSVAFACAVLLGMLVFSTAPTTHEGFEFFPSTAELIAAFVVFVLFLSVVVALVVGAVSSLRHSHRQRDRQVSRTGGDT